MKLDELRRLAAAFCIFAGWIITGATNGHLNQPLNATGAFASISCLLTAIAISVTLR